MMNGDALVSLASRTGTRIRHDVPGSAVTTIAAGGALKTLLEPETSAQLSSLIAALTENGLPYRVLGAGSNLLIDDAGVSDCVIRLGAGFREVTFLDETTVVVGAACGLMRVSRNLSAQGLAGLEFASGIPASIGGAVRMNAGAHGGQMADIVESVECVTPTGESLSLTPHDLNFGYRRSTLPMGAIVVAVRLQLRRGDPAAIERKRGELLAYRKSTQPLTVPSFGSVFKNPSATKSAGAIIESLGLKGHRLGGAEVSALHGNWIINPARTATVGEVRGLIEVCQRRALEAGEEPLEPEVVLWQNR